MPKVFVGQNTKQPVALSKAGRQLEIRQIGAAVAADQPVLLLGEVVVADTGAMQPPQRLFGRTKISDVARRLDQMKRNAVDETAHQRLPAAPQEFRPDIKA